tara:strand:+ start:94 stop:2025 length:1932 start_codon:yes stop_codon:yes gene_type:complete
LLVNTDILYDEVIENLITYPTWCVDVETDGLSVDAGNRLCGIGVSISETSGDIKTFYFPFRHNAGQNLELTYLDDLLTTMSCRTHLIGYNLKFDLRFLEEDGLDLRYKTLIDTMLLVRLTAHSEVRDFGLTKTIKRLYGEEEAQYELEMKKELRRELAKLDPPVKTSSGNYSLGSVELIGPYCEKDVYYTYKLYNELLPKVESSGQLDVLHMQYDLTRVLYEMECTGVKIDTDYAQESINKVKDQQARVEQQIYALVGKEFNMRSTVELGEVFHELGIYSSLKTQKGAESWSEKALKEIDHPLAILIRQYRALYKLSSTYLEPYLETEILHTSFCNWGTITGRLSSREPNLQNIPRTHFKLENLDLDVTTTQDDWGFKGEGYYDEKDPTQVAMRRLFIPREDYQFVSFDYSQMEVRVFLSYLDNPEMQDLLNRTDVDFHSETAKIAFGSDETHPEFKEHRQMAKSITFGIMYGIGTWLLSQQMQTTMPKAAQYKKRYLDSITGAKEFIDGVEKAVEDRGWIKNRYGRVYKVLPEFSYKGVNYLVQGTSADILNERLIEISEFLADKKSRMLLQVHDEIIFEIHNTEMDSIIEPIVNLMQSNSLNIPLFVDQEICTPSWANKQDVQDWVQSRKSDISQYIDWDI